MYEVLGNHDPAVLFERHLRTPVDTAFDHPGVRFLLFNNSRTASHLGFVTAGQAGWLGTQCREAADKGLRWSPAATSRSTRTPTRTAGGTSSRPSMTAFYAVIDGDGDRFMACLHGHFHNGIRGWRGRGRPIEVVVPSVGYNKDRKLSAAVAEKKAVGELWPEYVLATLGNGRLTLRYKPLGHDPHGEDAADVA